MIRTRTSVFLHNVLLAMRVALTLSLVTLCTAPATAAETSGFTPMVIQQVSVTRQLAMLQGVCDAGTLGVEDGAALCKVCPSFTSDAGGKASRLQITNVIEGAFTRPNAAEALIDVAGCESHSELYGGAVILERTGEGWRRVFYRAGFRPSQCITFRTLNQTIGVACNIVDAAQGVQLGELVWVDLREGKYIETSLLRWFDNVQSNPRRLVSIFPQRFMKSDFNQDGRVDLRVTLRLREQAVPEKYSGAIDAIAGGYPFAAPETLRLIYLFDGNGFTLQTDSEAVKKRVDLLLERYLPE